MENRSYKKGLICAIMCSVIWGILPIYWDALNTISSLVVIFYRVTLMALTCFAVLYYQTRSIKAIFVPMFENKKKLWTYIIAAILSCVIVVVCFLTDPIAIGDHFVLTERNSPDRSSYLHYDIQLGNEAKSGEIYVEQWIDGTCVKSTPVIMTQYVDSIEITMTERRENESTVGTDIQIETNQYGGSLLTYFEYPGNYNFRGWGFTAYELNEKRKLDKNEEVILAAKVFDTGSGIRAFDCETLANEPERLENASHMLVVRAIFSEDPLGVVMQEIVSFPKEILSLNDVIILSQKEHDLSWEDFEKYDYIETGSGLYIRVYEINEKFQLMIGGAGPESEPMYIYLCLKETSDTRIDIRDGGVKAFISEYNSEDSETESK